MSDLEFTREDAKQSWLQHLPDYGFAFSGIWSYFTHLQEINLKVNLVSRKLTPPDLWTDHILDCAIALPFFDPNHSILDIGSGGGLPGAILGICLPETPVVCLDKSSKKTHYSSRLFNNLGLDNVRAISNPNETGEIHCCTSRALGKISKILGLCEDIDPSSSSWRYLLYKARKVNIDEEIEALDQNQYQVQVHPLLIQNSIKERHLIELQSH